MNDVKHKGPPAERRFGTFGGVFTPCTLTILGVIMFLRFGNVVGQAGIFDALAIVVAAKTITVLTTLSLSAIATNTRVRGGGAYYLISRSLGHEFGGSIGIVFFAAQAIAVALYVIGFSEAFVTTVPGNFPLVWIATTVNIAVFLCVLTGAGWTGIESLVQCHGLGTIRPNTILLGWPEQLERPRELGDMLRTVAALECSVLALRFGAVPEDPWHAPRGTIDVWWRGKGNGALMLLLAHLLSQNSDWRGRSIRLLRVISNAEATEPVTDNLTDLIDSSRIRAEPVVLLGDDVQAMIQEQSKSAAIVFLGFEPPDEGSERDFFTRMESFAGNLDHVVFLHSVGGMSLES